jgi:bifunctional non-homologous end joining protein LigD
LGLEDYRKKRDFDQTSEPEPEVKSSDSGRAFVIQKHAATRLHYDLRLELDGVLLSWAVPKGPSLDPSERHLAVHVEDHPLDYGDFEGTIPKGEYGGGTVMVWDRGTWEAAGESADDPARAYAEGKLKFRLHGAKLHGNWMLVRLRPRPGEDDKDNWLLFKERDEEARKGDEAAITERAPDSVKTGRSLDEIAADADRVWGDEGERPGRPDASSVEGARKAPLPARLEPQLATLVTDAPTGGDWIHEIKLDGYRVLCRLEHGEGRFFTRRGADWTDHFPTLTEPIRDVPATRALLDGEVVYLKADGRTSFLRLASALQSGTDPDARIVYYVFDLLHLDGYDLTRAPLFARKEALRGLLAGLPAEGRVRYVEHLEGHGEEFYRQACELALEGSIAKRAAGQYRSGRGRDWVKVKCLHREEFVIAGFTERADGPGGIGALLMSYHEKPGGPLRFAGRVGTGWDEKTMRDVRRRLDALRQDEPPIEGGPKGRRARDVRWVRPELVAEIEYLSWSGGDMFRHPSFEGLRLDKPADEVVPERAHPDATRPVAPPPENVPAVAAPSVDAAPEEDRNERTPSKGSAPAPRRTKSRGKKSVVVGDVAISNPDKVMYPDIGLTKLEVARYYEDVADWLLPYVARRPLTLVRCPDGYTGQCFFQKHAMDHFPETVLRVPIPEGDEVETYVAVDSAAGLLSLVQMGVLEFHVWGSHMETLEKPDQLVFDLDPDAGLPFNRVIEAARLMRTALDGLGLESFVKTTGGKGLHVVVPIAPTRPWDEAKAFSKALAEAIVAADPDRYIATMSLKKRKGKVYIDYLRNGRGATYVTPFSTRRRPGAPVSTPLRWDELTGRLKPDRYTVRNLQRRLARLESDPWEGYHEVRQKLTAAMDRSVGVGRQAA